jgi:hypothetical protein
MKMRTYNLSAEIIQDFCQDAIACGELPTFEQIEDLVGRYAEQTCEVLGIIRHDYDSGYAGYEYETELSCGHTWYDGYDEYPAYCPQCGAKVTPKCSETTPKCSETTPKTMEDEE